MNAKALMAKCLEKQGSYLYCPFGPEPVCARVGKRIFAEIFISKPWVTFKCDALYGLMMREKYPGVIRRGYHCPPPQHPYNNTVTLDGTVPDVELFAMLDHSYARALSSQTKAEREAALARPHEEDITGGIDALADLANQSQRT
jgi:predicted DNA-binding protein (MmcQ/YjbR family)